MRDARTKDLVTKIRAEVGFRFFELINYCLCVLKITFEL